MPSLNFENEEGEFRRFYDEKAQLLEDAKNSYITLIPHYQERCHPSYSQTRGPPLPGKMSPLLFANPGA